jgi:beta-phosphoglucomutase-like phosphatase (HAD superfamily)
VRRAREPDAVLQAVMFDMDGLLVDTEPLWFEVESEIMARLGGTWSHADQAKLVGGSLGKSVAYMCAKAAPVPPARSGARHLSADQAGEWPPGEAAVAEWMVDGMVTRIASRGATLMPGAAELLADVAAARVPRALVTSSRRPVMDAVLAQLAQSLAWQGSGADQPVSDTHARGAQASGLFDVTVCAADLTQAKPHPAPYLLAARLLDADPARCVVLEDAPNGVAAAEAAGCLVVVVPGVAAVPPRDGRVVVPSLRAVSAGWLADLVASPRTSSR